MSVNHSISFFIASVKNATAVNKEFVDFQHSSIIESIVSILQNEGFIKKFEILQHKDSAAFKFIRVYLSYRKNVSTIKLFKVISKPGKRVYSSYSDIPMSRAGLGVVILTTNKGVITDKLARQLKVGGELLCEVF